MKRLAAVAAGVVLCALLLAVLRPRRRAQRLLADLGEVHLGVTGSGEVRALAARYGGDAECAGDACMFHFANVWLARLHLAPPAQFSVLVQFAPAESGGAVAAVDRALLVERESGTVSALVFDRLSSDAPPQPENVSRDRGGRAVRTVVELSPTSSPAERRRGLDFNLGCLTRPGGCSSSAQLLP